LEKRLGVEDFKQQGYFPQQIPHLAAAVDLDIRKGILQNHF
jgi:hypothetical protein